MLNEENGENRTKINQNKKVVNGTVQYGTVEKGKSGVKWRSSLFLRKIQKNLKLK